MIDANTAVSWKPILNEFFEQERFNELMAFLDQENLANRPFYPAQSEIYEAFNRTPFDRVKVILLGQDPYHGIGQAHGLSFSVNDGIPIPPSLRNIFKGLKVDFPNYTAPLSGNLSKWAEQGVLLLNATLTVRAGEAGSHQKKGWEEFTDSVIKQLSAKRENLVFLLWGNFAQGKVSMIDQGKHLILQAPHPSPLSAYKGFFNCRHFRKTNTYLVQHGIDPIDWQL
jgi:uracil-DNA glycosylase